MIRWLFSGPICVSSYLWLSAGREVLLGHFWSRQKHEKNENDWALSCFLQHIIPAFIICHQSSFQCRLCHECERPAANHVVIDMKRASKGARWSALFILMKALLPEPTLCNHADVDLWPIIETYDCLLQGVYCLFTCHVIKYCSF